MPTVVRGDGSGNAPSNLVHGSKIVKVREEDLRLHHLIKAAAGGFQRSGKILQDVRRLQLDVRSVEREVRMLARFGRHAVLVVGRDLARGEDRVAENVRLRIIGDRLRPGGSHDLVDEARARHVGDEIDLDQRILDEKPGRADGRARQRHLEIAPPHLVESSEVVEVSEEHLRLHHMIK